MTLYRKLLTVSVSLIICTTLNAQLQVDHLSFKGFSAIGFGGFLNFAVPVSDADYITAELGVDVFSSNGNHVVQIPMLVGYRYTFDRTGTGFYLEPNAGYSYGGTDIQLADSLGNYYDQKVSGLAAGLGLGYLFQPTGRVQFNLGVRYEHIFGSTGQNMFSFRISHSFTFGRRE
ncbi:MAG TPA: hypothetical protein VG052_00340 [Puia sp.]|jgi:hypothetical protein|nr:hypothetical protein [Puia sp.]